jgi:glycosyltransferase involved in cell wall biosynthesis
VRIAVVHNLVLGGARRRLASQVEHLNGEIIEICLGTATPITSDACVLPVRRVAPRLTRLLRPPARFLDLATLELAWGRAAQAIRSSGADVVYLNPCQYLQAPPVLQDGGPPALYFCDEPRIGHAEPEARATRNSLTNPLYAAIYARECRLDRRTTSRACRLATNSRYTAAEIERVYGRTATVIKMGVAEALLQRTPAAPSDRFLLSVGTLIPTKGHDLVLRAAAVAAARPRVQIVAPRPAPREEARLRVLAEQLGVDVAIRVGITDGELAGLYASAYATLYLALREPLGLVALEAQACGCPIIVAAEGGLPETIVDGITGWQVPRDPAMVASMVDRLADRELHQRMSAAAREHAKGYTWEASAAQVESLLAEVRMSARTS